MEGLGGVLWAIVMGSEREVLVGISFFFISLFRSFTFVDRACVDRYPLA